MRYSENIIIELTFDYEKKNVIGNERYHFNKILKNLKKDIEKMEYASYFPDDLTKYLRENSVSWKDIELFYINYADITTKSIKTQEVNVYKEGIDTGKKKLLRSHVVDAGIIGIMYHGPVSFFNESIKWLRSEIKYYGNDSISKCRIYTTEE